MLRASVFQLTSGVVSSSSSSPSSSPLVRVLVDLPLLHWDLLDGVGHDRLGAAGAAHRRRRTTTRRRRTTPSTGGGREKILGIYVSLSCALSLSLSLCPTRHSIPFT